VSILDAILPDGLDADGMTPDEKRQHDAFIAHRALGLLMQRIPVDVPITRWSIEGFDIEAELNDLPFTKAQVRSTMRRAAKALGFEYTARPFSTERDKISVIGSVDGVTRCEIWVLVDPCVCSCHSAVTE
jgi:hypothetical protein